MTTHNFFFFSFQPNNILGEVDKAILSGDGQFDSPGTSTQFRRYTMLEKVTGVLLDFAVVYKVQYDVSTKICGTLLYGMQCDYIAIRICAFHIRKGSLFKWDIRDK